MPDMLVPLYTLPDQTEVLSKMKESSITIRRPLAPEKSKVLAWIKEHFHQGWADECEVAFSRVPVSCYVAIHEGEMIGFSCYDATCRNFFGPTGVSEAARGKGAGKALLLAALHSMKEEGYAYAIIGGAGPTEFYKLAAGAVEIPNSVPGIYAGLL